LILRTPTYKYNKNKPITPIGLTNNEFKQSMIFRILRSKVLKEWIPRPITTIV